MTFIAALIGISTIAFLINGLINYQPVKFSEALIVFTFGFTFLVLAYANFKSAAKPNTVYDFLAISVGGVFVLNGAIFFGFYKYRLKYSHENIVIKISEDPLLYWGYVFVNICVIFGSLIYFVHYKKTKDPDYGLKKEVYKKEAKSSDVIKHKVIPPKKNICNEHQIKKRTTSIMTDLEKLADLLEISSSEELKDKSNQLFAELCEKYKDDDLALETIKVSQDFFVKELQQRQANEKA